MDDLNAIDVVTGERDHENAEENFYRNCLMQSCKHGPKSQKKYFQHFVESMPLRIEAVLRAK